MHVAFDAGISHPDIHPREVKTYTDKKFYTKMFIAAFFMIF